MNEKAQWNSNYNYGRVRMNVIFPRTTWTVRNTEVSVIIFKFPKWEIRLYKESAEKKN